MSGIPGLTKEEVDRFYRSAVVGLALLDDRSGGGRRFGANADARWQAFRGGLEDWDRIELLVRDAAVAYAAGFAPRVVFDLPALADDEPCGPDWSGPDPTTAAALLRSALEPPKDPRAALARVADVWGKGTAADVALPEIQPATRMLVAGAGAVIALAGVFLGRPELDLADQAVLVAGDPATRQLFGLAVAFFGSRRPVRIVRFDASPDELRALGVARVDVAITSPDLPGEARAQVAALARQLGARG